QHTLSARLGKERWWDPKWKLLPKRDLSQVAVAMNRIKRDGRHPNIGRVVSGLTLGFWVGLFAARHEQKLWKGNALRMTFPHAPRRELGYHRLRARLNGFRHLRNRVFHHEPIWRWTELDDAYANILTLTAWLSTDMHQTLQPHDRFEGIYRAGYLPYLDKLPEPGCPRNG